jgi:3-oxoacyl-[acyl-carrier-protein] synthase-3
MSFTVDAIPKLLDQVLARANVKREDIQLYLLHQATHKMLSALQDRLGISEKEMPICLKNCGNTVSSTIPILIHNLRRSGELKPGITTMLVGFGVGWSWAGCIWRET